MSRRDVHTPPPQPLPKVFGRYLLLRRLSRGGMGEIFLAKSGQLTGFEKLCVIKKILPDLAEDREFIRRFIDEAQVAIKLSHGNIATVFEVGMVEGEYFLAIEYVEGRDLRRMLSRLHERRERLPPDLALFIVRDVAAGLAYAHRKTDEHGKPLNLVHCDISPPNVVVSFEGEVKIIDFGIAKSAMRISATNPRVGFGKFGYMAPEQLVRGGVVDRRTDVYAAGVLLYELLTGERLFQVPEGGDHRLIARQVTRGEHPLPSDKDPSLAPYDAIVKKALAPDPVARYPFAEDLRDAVQAALVALNPTLTADRLGSYVRELFADELADERAFLLEASRTDLSPYADELTGAKTQTVSFALHADVEGAIPAHVPDEIEHSGTMLVDRYASAAPRQVRRWPIAAGGALGLLVGGGALAFMLANRDAPATPAPAVAPQPFVVQPIVAGPPEPAPTPPVELPAAPASRPDPLGSTSPAQAEERGSRARRPERAAPARKPSPAGSAPSPAQVQAKYQAVAREYSGFKRRYGGRLEAEWNDILNLVTYGGGADKHVRLDGKLDRFRKRMAEIRSE